MLLMAMSTDRFLPGLQVSSAWVWSHSEWGQPWSLPFDSCSPLLSSGRECWPFWKAQGQLTEERETDPCWVCMVWDTV